MSLVKRWIATIRSRARSSSLGVRLAAGALAALVLAGGVWLAAEVSGRRPEMVVVLAEPLAGADASAAVELARRNGIEHRLYRGQLLVPRERLEEFRALLAYERVVPTEKVLTFDQIARENDIWRTQAQNAKRWQAAKMSALSQLIEHFPAVRRATVIFEAPPQHGLGRHSVEPTAAVKVEMVDGQQMSPKLAAAIADLVAGSIAGMKRRDVRIVDNEGHSCRLEEDDPLAGTDRIEPLRRTEAYYTDKIHHALHYIDGVMVEVSVCPDGAVVRCTGASVSVPRTHVAAICRPAGPDASAEPNDAELDALAAGKLARIRQTVMNVIAAADANAVKVDWYHDAPQTTASVLNVPMALPEPPRTGGSGAQLAGVLVTAALVVAGVVCGWLAWGRRWGRSAAASEEAAGEVVLHGERHGPAEGAYEPQAGDDPLTALQRAGSDELLKLLQGEHPQTVALVLAHVEAATAASVLGELSRDRQIEVARRIAEMGRIDAEVVAEVARGLVLRRTNALAGRSDRVGGVSKVARILHHAGYATEKAVLEGLNGAEPALAELIRKRMFVFEDVALLPGDLLSSALSTLGTDELAIALRTAGGELRQKVLASLPRATAVEVNAQMERIGPVRLSDVEAAQEHVVAAVRRLEAGRYVSARVASENEVLA